MLVRKTWLLKEKGGRKIVTAGPRPLFIAPFAVSNRVLLSDPIVCSSAKRQKQIVGPTVSSKGMRCLLTVTMAIIRLVTGPIWGFLSSVGLVSWFSYPCTINRRLAFKQINVSDLTAERIAWSVIEIVRFNQKFDWIFFFSSLNT